MKSEYTSPSMEIFELEENDIITTSVYNDDWTNPDNLLKNGDVSGWSNFH
mgnify:CR=1 FL=1